MAKGNPNPSPETRFKPGQSGNPSGRSSEELKAHVEAAKIAAKLKLEALSCLQELVTNETDGEKLTKEDIISMLMNGDALRMFKEVEDRAYGTATQSINNTHDVSDPIKELMGYVESNGKRVGDT